MEPEAIPTDRIVHPLSREDELGAQLLAALAVVVHRYSERSQVVLGYRSGDGQPARHVLLDLAGEDTFAELLARVGSTLGASAGQGGDPDVVLVIGAEVPEVPIGECLLHARAGADGLELEHRGGDAVQGVEGAALVGHVLTLLQAALADPSTPIAVLAMLTEPERRRLLIELNDTAAPYPSECLHLLIAQQASSTPDRVAIEFENQQLTYAQLDSRANQLAHHLLDLGVGPEVLVGICTTRSLEMVVGLLGILKAGGAYVPIDPTYPADRQAYMLSNSMAPVVVTQSQLRDSIPPGSADVVCLDSDWPEIAQRPSAPPAVAADPEQLAYVIYTSGSTGKPKGVQISHCALVNFLTTMRQRPGLSEHDVLVAVTTLSFDIAGLELYLPLTSGARIVIAPAAATEDPRALSALLESTEASIMQATPTTWRMLIDGGWPGRPGMKALCGGEALPVALADKLVGSGLELWNMYGPTETTIWSTCARIATQGETLTIGRPIANTTLYILDAAMTPVPSGVAGELWIGGDGLARGYRARPDLTDERFVAHPFDETPDAKIYRTGDLARYRLDGTVEFLGRIDHQVKVRGFRIELGEIETVLARHPQVVEAVVVARGSGAEAELAAYVTAAGEAVPAHELRDHIGHSVPDYMVPSTVTTLEAFPLTPNGKVDRKALPEPVRERSDAHEIVAPRTSLERRLAAIWERELDIRPIGVTDDFFDLGVTSIVAATLFAAIERDLGDSLALGAIFRAPTIEKLAQLIEGEEDSSRWTSLVPIQPHGSRPPIFCVHGGAGTILHLQPLARRLGSEQPFYGLQSSGLYGGSAPIPTVEEMAAHYLTEMRQVHTGGPWLIAGYCFGTIVAFEIAQRLLEQGEDVRMVALFNGPSPAWIKQWAWFGNQPSQRRLKPRPPRMTRKEQVLRALRDPKRFFTAFAWYAGQEIGKLRVRLALARSRPIPEREREEFFFDLHARAERAYEPVSCSKDLLVFYGEGLYEDPALGWGELAQGGIQTVAVPGEQNNNRDVMKEPGVQFVAESIEEYLGAVMPAAHAEAAGTR